MEEKTCKYCQKLIDSKALKCPYCQEWLNKTTLSWKNPYFFPMLFILAGIGSIKYFEKRAMSLTKSSESIRYKDSHKLQIQNVILKKDKGVPRIIAEIENKEPFTWTSVEVLAVYMDKQNKPIYLGSDYIRELRPGEKRVFQVNGPCANENVSFADYDHYELKIETADYYPWSNK